ncbi:MAG: ATP-binding protein [Candidatus Aquicultor sp.]
MNTLSQPVSIEIPAKPEYAGIARLIVAGYAGLLGFDSEIVEDIKIAVSEACTNAIMQLHKQSRSEEMVVDIAAYTNDDNLVIDVEYQAENVQQITKPDSQSIEKDLGMSILTSIMDEVDMIAAQNQGVILRLVKKIPKR